MEEAASQASAKLIDGALSGDTNALIIILVIGVPMWLLIIDKLWFHYSRKKQGVPREASIYRDAADINTSLEALKTISDRQTEILEEISKIQAVSVETLRTNLPKLDEIHTNVRLNGDRANQLLARAKG